MLYILAVMITTLTACLSLIGQIHYMDATTRPRDTTKLAYTVAGLAWTAFAIWFHPVLWVIVVTSQLFMFVKGWDYLTVRASA